MIARDAVATLTVRDQLCAAWLGPDNQPTNANTPAQGEGVAAGD